VTRTQWEIARDLELAQRRREAAALHQRYLKGEITEADYHRMSRDIGKNDDDLTRAAS
jgi:uncharacterized membrane protein